MATRKCLECGATFTIRHHTQVCCSPACQKARKRKQDRAYNALRRRDPDLAQESRYRAELVRERDRKARDRAAFLAARDAAYEREYGSPVGRPRGRLTVPLASFAATPCTPDSIAPIARFDASRFRAAVHND